MATRTLIHVFAALAASVPGATWAAGFEAMELCACEVSALSADGSAAVGVFNSESDWREPFLWAAGKGLQRLGRRPVNLNTLYEQPAISANGRLVAATIMAAEGTHAVQGLWSEDTGWTELGPLPSDTVIHDGAVSTVMGMSPDGSVVVGTHSRRTDTDATSSAARWDAAAGVVDLGGGSHESRIHGASRRGRVMVGVAVNPDALFDRAAVWDDRGHRWWLGPETPSRATAVNAQGNAIAGAQLDLATGNYGGMLWRREGKRWVAQALGAPADWRGPSLAYGVSGDGRTVVGQASRYSTWMGCWGCQGGWVWTPETGTVAANEFFEGAGFGVDRIYRIRTVAAVSDDGQVFAVVAHRNDGGEPWLRSFLVRRLGTTAK